MRRMRALFNDNLELQSLIHHAGDLSRLQKIWASVAPENLREFSMAGGLKNRRITVYATNGAVAAKLKLLAPTLLKNLQIKGLEVTSIRVEVQVQSLQRQPRKPAKTLSRQAAKSLHSLADTLPESPLKSALENLANKAGA